MGCCLSLKCAATVFHVSWFLILLLCLSILVFNVVCANIAKTTWAVYNIIKIAYIDLVMVPLILMYIVDNYPYVLCCVCVCMCVCLCVCVLILGAGDACSWIV